MPLISRSNRKPRQGAAAVEMAIVCVILLMFLFGLFEYCRYLFILHISNNAARDTARFAVVHTNGGTMPGEPASITTNDLIALVNTGELGSVKIGAGMSGMQHNLDGYTVEIFQVDSNGLAQSPATASAVANSPWDHTPFAQKIAVRITGSYKPILPSFLFLPASIPVNVTVMASSEAN